MIVDRNLFMKINLIKYFQAQLAFQFEVSEAGVAYFKMSKDVQVLMDSTTIVVISIANIEGI